MRELCVISWRRGQLALLVLGCGAGLACAKAGDRPDGALIDGGAIGGTETSTGKGGDGAGGAMGGTGGGMAVDASAAGGGAGGAGGTPAGGGGGGEVFLDDFLGSSIEADKWTAVDRISDQANGEIDCNVAANVSVSGGFLLGVSRFEDHTCGDTGLEPSLHHYTSWNLQQRTAPFLYGTIAVRAKLPGGIGVWPAIWMLGYKWQPSQAATANVPGANWPHDGWCEVDIAEFMGNARDRVNNTVHFNAPGGAHEARLPFDATTRYMVYRLQWSAGSLVWSVDAEDGAGFRTLRTVIGSASVPDVPMYLVLNAAIGGTGGGTPNPATFPQTFSVDWVRITR
jgi:beta-glucanase (GH16 family)